MSTQVVYRVFGWCYIILGVWGFIFHQFGDYMQLSSQDNFILLGLGILFIGLARCRSRYRLSGGTLLGLILLSWSGLPYLPTMPYLHSPHPLELLVRILTGAWTIYLAIAELLAWRKIA
ncbi:hypothetical protein [Alicyclobacillus tolerans]|uniref:Uncharacterized protein n=1 Tax=Alicyclobacillus tolerans TaxID=90970 RepID=A0ABT9LXM6_9BACL|nr:hypothetical protein [Alicyclobacillus tengchongensis]MDP9729014.1 hypothetical protein [Alicyclobacillus tengchongensis]